MQNRIQVLVDLLNHPPNLAKMEQHLKALPWDSEELVTLEHAHVIKILNGYLTGKYTASTVEHWANLIEGRDDIGRAAAGLNDVIHVLANPILEGALTPAYAHRLLKML